MIYLEIGNPPHPAVQCTVPMGYDMGPLYSCEGEEEEKRFSSLLFLFGSR
jgi:hypothetical protein